MSRGRFCFLEECRRVFVIRGHYYRYISSFPFNPSVSAFIKFAFYHQPYACSEPFFTGFFIRGWSNSVKP